MFEKLGKRLGAGGLDTLDVGGHPRNEIAGRTAEKKLQRLAQDSPEDVIAEVPHDSLSEPRGRRHRTVFRDCLEDRGADEKSQKRCAAQIAELQGQSH